MFNWIYRKLVEGRPVEISCNKISDLVVRFVKWINHVVKVPIAYVDRAIAYFPRRSMIKRTEIENDTIMFLTYQGDYTCNPKAIANEILRQKLPLKIVWATTNETEDVEFPKQITPILRGTYEFYKAAAAAHILVDNTHNLPRLGVHKREGQVVFQTWHGSLGIKRLDGDVVMNHKWRKLQKTCIRETDYCITNSTFEEDVFDTSYWPGVPTLRFGHARNDILLTDNTERLDEVSKRVKEKLRIPPNKKICMYAPTHRDNVDESYTDLNYPLLKESLEKRFGGDWVILLRFHSRLRKKSSQWLNHLPYYVIDGTGYDDIQELMVVTDVGITDYSSWIFDYILLKRPGFILAGDIDEFEKNRAFYYPLTSTPFPIATDEKALSLNIQEFNNNLYRERVESFLDERGCMEDGHACERITEKIREITGNKK